LNDKPLSKIIMKKHWFAVIIPLSLCLLSYSCGSKSDKTASDVLLTDSIETVESTQETVETEAAVVEDEGDPTIIPASVNKMKMVVDNRGNVVGRYVQTNPTTYTVSVQDEIEVPKLGHKIVEYSARNGQGIVYTLRKNVNVRTQPNLKSPVIFQITCKDGELPQTYPCLGKTKEWYKIKVRGKEGYVRHDLVEWDGMDTF
jgi:hypothetical protein